VQEVVVVDSDRSGSLPPSAAQHSSSSIPPSHALPLAIKLVLAPEDRVEAALGRIWTSGVLERLALGEALERHLAFALLHSRPFAARAADACIEHYGWSEMSRLRWIDPLLARVHASRATRRPPSIELNAEHNTTRVPRFSALLLTLALVAMSVF
jgi:hypothetical protein